MASGLVVAPGGKVTPEMEEMLKIIARENLVLATGHVHPEEIVAVAKRAKELGVQQHPGHARLHQYSRA